MSNKDILTIRLSFDKGNGIEIFANDKYLTDTRTLTEAIDCLGHDFRKYELVDLALDKVNICAKENQKLNTD